MMIKHKYEFWRGLSSAGVEKSSARVEVLSAGAYSAWVEKLIRVEHHIFVAYAQHMLSIYLVYAIYLGTFRDSTPKISAYAEHMLSIYR